MKNKRITMAIVPVVLIILATSVFFLLKGKKQENDNAKNNGVVITNGNFSYEVKEEIEQEPIKLENLKIEKDFEVSDVEQKEDKLTIKVNADVSEAKEAYEMAYLTKTSIEDLNKDQISLKGVKKFEIIISGQANTWLYDGSEKIKEITIK